MSACVYRFWNAAEELLYIGMSGGLAARLDSHHAVLPWKVVKITVEWFSSKEEAFEAEAKAINTEHPKMNCRRKNGPKKVQPLPQVIERAKELYKQHGTWQLAADAVGLNIGNLHKLSTGKLAPSKTMLQKLGLERVTAVRKVK